MAISKASISTTVISQAESYDGVCARIVRLKDVLNGASYQMVRAAPRGAYRTETWIENWPSKAYQSVLVLGLNHPGKKPHLDYWERCDTRGNTHLREISELIKLWLWSYYGLAAMPLPYLLENGGVFLKDAAVLSGMGIIGRNNLLLHPEWGPRIRLRAILLEGDFQSTQALHGFAPCKTCEVFCNSACPLQAFPHGKYNWSICHRQMNADYENGVPEGKNGKPNRVVKHCRACELSCPVGA